MRVLGIDFGERRIGLAISDEGARIATPLVTLRRRDDRSAIREILEIARREGVGRLVVGEPRNVDGSRGAAAERIGRFAGRLAVASGLPLELVGETLTSQEAERRLAAAGVTPGKRRERVDQVAAQIVLQEALDRQRERA